jgi:hypothetical protein
LPDGIPCSRLINGKYVRERDEHVLSSAIVQRDLRK